MTTRTLNCAPALPASATAAEPIGDFFARRSAEEFEAARAAQPRAAHFHDMLGALYAALAAQRW